MKKLVFGCGYFGKRVAQTWVRNGDEVFALTRSRAHTEEWTSSGDDNFPSLPFSRGEGRGEGFHSSSAGIQPLVGDVTLPKLLPEFPNAKTVLYAIGFDRSAGSSMREVYVEGLKNVLARLPASVSRFIYISSTSVYGQQSGEWIDEESPCKPNRENGQICLEAERCLEEFSQKENSPTVTILRLAGIYGPGRLLRRIDELKSQLEFTGNPDALINLIHVDDAAAAVLACEHNAVSFRYLISDDRPVTRREYYQQLAKTIEAEPPKFSEENSPDRSNLGKRCRNTKMKSELDFTLHYPTIAAGIPHAMAETDLSS